MSRTRKGTKGPGWEPWSCKTERQEQKADYMEPEEPNTTHEDRCLLCRGRGEMISVAGGPAACNNCGARRVKGGLWTWRIEFAPKACMHGTVRPEHCPSCDTMASVEFPPAKPESFGVTKPERSG